MAIYAALMTLQVSVEEAEAQASEDARDAYDDVPYEACDQRYILRCQVESVEVIANGAADLVCLYDLHREAIAVDESLTLACNDKLRRDPDLLQIPLLHHRVLLQRLQKLV